MKTKLIIVLMCMLCTTTQVKAIPIIWSYGETIEHVMDLPTTEEFDIVCNDGQTHHFDLGIKHSQFSLLLCPLWNYGDEDYVLYTKDEVNGQDEIFKALSSSEVSYLQQSYNIPAEPELPFWDRWGGKLAFLGILLLLFIIKIVTFNP